VATLRWGSATDPGRIRPDNEDNVLAAPRVFAVADGMGGHRAGEVASALAIDLLRSRLSEPGAALDDVVSAIAEANGDIYRAALDNPAQQGMGTTITALIVISDAGADGPGETDSQGAAPAADTPELFALINVGDSRTYLLRHGRLRRVTVDHSYVQELVTTGHITDDEARTHPRRNIVTRALGIDPSVRVDAWTLPIVRGDRFLLCSDGLVDEVRDDAINDVLTTIPDAQSAADELVALANREGGRDNVTVVVVDVLEGATPPDPETELDLEPAWEPGATTGTWTVDDPETQATEFEDLAELAADPTTPAAAAAADATPTAPSRPVTDQAPAVAQEVAAPRRRRRLAGFLGALGVLAVLILAFVITAAYARRGYFVAFDTSNDVVIYRGRPDGFLWFDPTVENPTVFSRDQLDDRSIDRVVRRPEFGSLGNAQEFVAEQLQTTTTTSPPTTTTSPPTTTTAPTTTTRPRRTTTTGP
jgi:protein phosphatase